MRRGSTSATILTVPESLDLTAAKAVYVTFAQGSKLLTKKTGDPRLEIEAHVCRVRMTQQETLDFSVGPVEIQLRWLMLERLYKAGIYLDTGAMVGGLAGPMDKKLGQIQAQKARA